MPVPETTVLQHLSGLAAVAPGGRTAVIGEVFTGAPLGSVPIADAGDVTTALAAARTAQREWAARPLDGPGGNPGHPRGHALLHPAPHPVCCTRAGCPARSRWSPVSAYTTAPRAWSA